MKVRNHHLHKVKDSELAAISRLECIFCKRVVQGPRILNHTAGCKVIRKKLPNRQCRFCSRNFDEVACLLHESCCDKRDERYLNGEDVYKCLNCHKDFHRLYSLKSHLGRCLDSLIQFSFESYEYHIREKWAWTYQNAGGSRESTSSTMDDFVSGEKDAPFFSHHQHDHSSMMESDTTTTHMLEANLSDVNMLQELGFTEANVENTTRTFEESLKNWKLIRMHIDIGNGVPCYFCKQNVKKIPIWCHAKTCPEIRRQLQQFQSCRFCGGIQGDEFDRLWHEANCAENPERGRRTGNFKCYNCLVVKSRESLQRHLSRCIATLKECTMKSLAAFDKTLDKAPECPGKRSRTKINKGASLTGLRCKYCKQSLKSTGFLSSLQHAVECQGIAKMETTRVCRFCSIESSSTQSLMHETRCKKSLRHAHCFHCDKDFPSLAKLDRHMMTEVLTHLESYLPLVELDHDQKQNETLVDDIEIIEPPDPVKREDVIENGGILLVNDHLTIDASIPEEEKIPKKKHK